MCRQAGTSEKHCYKMRQFYWKHLQIRAKSQKCIHRERIAGWTWQDTGFNSQALHVTATNLFATHRQQHCQLLRPCPVKTKKNKEIKDPGKGHRKHTQFRFL
jgi:hypothetical protein